jgi:hypothetical protein
MKIKIIKVVWCWGLLRQTVNVTALMGHVVLSEGKQWHGKYQGTSSFMTGTAQWWLDRGCYKWGILLWYPARPREIFILPVIRTVLGPTQPHIQSVLRSVSLKVNWPGCEADHSCPSSAEVKNEWTYNSAPPYALKACTKAILSLPFALNNFRLLIQSYVLQENLWSCVHSSQCFTCV